MVKSCTILTLNDILLIVTKSPIFFIFIVLPNFLLGKISFTYIWDMIYFL